METSEVTRTFELQPRARRSTYVRGEDRRRGKEPSATANANTPRIGDGPAADKTSASTVRAVLITVAGLDTGSRANTVV